MKTGLSQHSLAYRPDVDGMRALAVIAVVTFHAFPSLLMGGFVGVDVFFVISGYLISSIVLKDLSRGTFSIARFYANRVRRIFPALALVLLACLLAGWFSLLPSEFEQLGKHALASAGFVQNFVLLGEHGYFDAASDAKPLMHLWSLAIEEQFYLVYPVLIWCAWRLRLNVLTIVLGLASLSFVANLFMVQASAATAFFSPHARAWELLMGAVIACLQHSGWRRVANPGSSRSADALLRNVLSFAGLALVVLPAMVLDKTVTFPGWYALAPVIGACCLILAGPDAWFNRRLLSNAWMVRMGLISYPLYLWHWPILSFLRLLNGGSISVGLTTVAVLSSIGLAIATYRWVEQPVRLGRRGMPRVLIPAVAVSMAGVLGWAVLWNAGVASRFPLAAQQLLSFKYEPGLDARVGDCWLYDGLDADAFSPECFVVDQKRRAPAVVFWGDSYAARLYAGIRKEVAPDISVGQFTRNSCPPVLGIGTEVCQRGNEHVLRVIAKNPPRTAVLFGAWNFYGTDWGVDSVAGRGLTGAVRALKAAGVERVLVIGPAPTWEKDLPKVVFEQWRQGRSTEVIPERLVSGWLPAPFDVEAQMTGLLASESVTYFSTLKSMCSTQGCVVSVPGTPRRLVSWDHGHFTLEGAQFVGAEMLASRLLLP